MKIQRRHWDCNIEISLITYMIYFHWLLRVCSENLKSCKIIWCIAYIWCMNTSSRTRTPVHGCGEGNYPSLQLWGGGMIAKSNEVLLCKSAEAWPRTRSLGCECEGQFNGLVSVDPYECKGLTAITRHCLLRSIKALFRVFPPFLNP